MQEDLLRFIKGVWSLMLSPLINFNSTSDRLSGTPRDTHMLPYKWELNEGCEKTSKGARRRQGKANGTFKKQFVN